MTEKDSQLIKECLNAAVNGPFLPGWEFETLFGFSRDEVAQVAKLWPNVDLGDKTVQMVVNQTLNNLAGYPIDQPNKWKDYISVSREELSTLFYSGKLWDIS